MNKHLFANFLLNNLKERYDIKENIRKVIKIDDFPCDEQDEQLEQIIIELFEIEDKECQLDEDYTRNFKYIASDSIYAYMEDEISIDEALDNLEEIARASKGEV